MNTTLHTVPRVDVMLVEAADFGYRLRSLSPDERMRVLPVHTRLAIVMAPHAAEAHQELVASTALELRAHSLASNPFG